MGIVAERLDRLSITLSSPDGGVVGTFRPPDGLSIEFRDGRWQGYTESGLADQLSRLMTLLWNGYDAARDAAIAEATGRPAVPFQQWTAEGRRFQAEREQTRFEGMSNRGVVYCTNVGLANWTFVVRDGGLAGLDEADFAAEVASAYAAMAADWHLKTHLLRDKHFPR